jgi:predicted Zn finger-like uncharacterized protein
MYTQCPECDVAFRVTAQVLKQAAGKVRCGGCGVAFNALAYLSEENPAASRPSADRPEGGAMSLEEPGEIEAGPPPKTISAAQSAALLKTLDQLAGEDIRIEDTGVEWRVLDPAEDPYDDFEPDPSPTIAQEPMRFDDNTPLPDDFDADDLSVAAPEPAVIAEPARSPDESQIDLVFGEPGEWQDLLGAVEEPVDVSGIEVLEEVGDDPVEASLDEDIEPVAEPEPEEQPLDMDTQFAIQAEAMGIDLSGMQQRLEEPDKADTSIDEDLMAAAFETEASAKVEAIDEPEPEEPLESELLETEPLESEILAEPEPLMEPEDMMGSGPEEDLAAALVFALEEMVDDEIEFDSELTDFDEPDVLEVPELSEEEMTINRMIDQDLLAIAVEDEDGFTSTIVQKQFSGAAEIPRGKVAKRPAGEGTVDKPIRFEDALALSEPDEDKAENANPLIETIIMEGEFIHHDLDKARLAAERRAASSSQLATRHDKDLYKEHYREKGRVGMISTVALLCIVLGLQVIHHSRAAFATSPAFQKTIGPIYRMVGSPVTPSWNIKGWRFEATKGSTDEETQVLTIYSRIGNKSDEALPYPLVHVSLTDRFEEIVGSRVLDPADYLVDNADPRQVIAAGGSFNAVFTIATPSVEATGFKLNVCYRQSDGQLRCAIEDFK